MKKLILALLIISCNTSQTTESRVKNYMKDSVVSTFNDPKSYEYISMSTDSVFMHQSIKQSIIKHENELDAENVKYNTDKIMYGNDPEFAKMEDAHQNIVKIINTQIKDYQANLAKPDSLIAVNVNVKCRAKNAMGALIVNTVNLRLKDNKFEVVSN